MTSNEKNDSFVGIVVNDGVVTCNFPVGFSLGNTEDDIKEDIKLLVKTLSMFSELKEKKAFNDYESNSDTNVFPLNACIYILSQYYSRGYYLENTAKSKKESYGKINWVKTLKTQRGFVKDNSVLFLSFIVQKKEINESAIISIINKFCVYESFKLVGFLFDLFPPLNYKIKLEKEYFLFCLRKKLISENNDNNRKLLSSMIDLIDYLGNLRTSNKIFWGVNDFSYVWEKMINFVYGEDRNQLFSPKTYWVLKNKGLCARSSLEPDTIMIIDKTIYIIDAKYYKFSIDADFKKLPMAMSISKQIIYGEHIKNNLHCFNYGSEIMKVYNLFLLPYNKYEYYGEFDNNNYSFIGTAYGNWVVNKDTSTTILGVMVDVKWLMSRGIKHSNVDRLSLAQFVKNNFVI